MLNIDVLVWVAGAALFVGWMARRSFKSTRNDNELMSIMAVRNRHQYGTTVPRKPWFGTPFFFLFALLCIVIWVLFS